MSYSPVVYEHMCRLAYLGYREGLQAKTTESCFSLLQVDVDRISADLDATWEVLAEPIQTVSDAYAGQPWLLMHCWKFFAGL
jgi:hypothetical protein